MRDKLLRNLKYVFISILSIFVIISFQNFGLSSSNSLRKMSNKIITPFYSGQLEQVFISAEVLGQTGKWWCDHHFGFNLGGQWQCLEVTNGGNCLSTAPKNSMVTCVKNPEIQKVLASVRPVNGQTGQWWCDHHFGVNLGGKWNCLSQTRVTNSSCSQNSVKGSAVTCARVLLGSGDSNYLLPDTTCTRDDLDADGKVFCKYTNYTRQRPQDTTYLMNRYVRVGVNKRLGGAIFELYGTDFINRIQEHGGSALQMSLWGYDASAAGAAYYKTTSCDSTAYSSAITCQQQNNGTPCEIMATTGWQINECSTVKSCPGWSAAAPINPIQAQTKNCGWDDQTAAVSSISALSVQGSVSPALKIMKNNPYNFTKSSAVDNLTWSQTVVTPKDAPYAEINYSVSYHGLSLGEHNQEIPAIFLNSQINPQVFFYEGNANYTDSAGSVTQAINSDMDTLILPGRQGQGPLPLAKKPRYLTEDWVSFCDASGAKCVTVATFDPRAKEIQPGRAGYITVLGRFAMPQGFSASWKIYMFPYRYDNVIEGKTVRQWIYDLKEKTVQQQ